MNNELMVAWFRYIDKKLDHQHEMLHHLSETLAAFALNQQDFWALNAAAAELKAKQAALKAAWDNATPPA